MMGLATSSSLGGRPSRIKGMIQEELWAQFGPIEGTNFQKALSKIRQTGSQLEYQSESKRLGNRFMAGVKRH